MKNEIIEARIKDLVKHYKHLWYQKAAYAPPPSAFEQELRELIYLIYG